MDFYIAVSGKVTNRGTRGTLNLSQFLETHLVACFVAR